MMLEYYKKPDETVKAWRNLWFHTGDLFYRDEDGFFYIVGRKKESIRRRGENISPYEIESVVNEHPSVLESAAVGVPSELGDEDVKVYLKLKPGAQLDFMEFIKWCDSKLPYYMVPRYVEVVDELPKTPTQRIQRFLLKERGVGNAFDALKAGYRPTRPIT
jgi:crotonobetaine/carnitine-CoA ligase